MLSPYRLRPPDERREDPYDVDLLAVYAGVWAICIVLVVCALIRGEVWSARTTLPGIFVVGIPYALRETIAAWWRERWRS